MSQIVLDFIAQETAALSRLVPVPTEPFGYGRDLSCVTDITERLDEVDPDSVDAISEALLRRLITPRGTLSDDPDYGFDIRAYCNRGVTEQEILSLQGQIRGEVTKDDRVSDATVTVTWVPNRLDVKVTVTPEDPAISDFSLTFAVSDGELALQEISQ